MKANKVLITGGDGYLGLRLAKRYLERTDLGVLLWVRSRDSAEFDSKYERLAAEFGGAANRVEYHTGDLAGPHPFESVDPQSIRQIVHSAAVTRFNIDEATARAVNTDGAAKLFGLAGRCRSLEAIGVLSTIYASGLQCGIIEERRLENSSGFANHYERSKWECETRLLDEFDHLPWRLLRIATVVADNDSGEVTQFNAFHNTLKLFFYGLLSLVPGNAETPLYFVTGDFVTAAVYELMNGASDSLICHVAHAREESIRLGDLIDLAFEVFDGNDDFKARHILKPLYSDADSFNLLTEGVKSFGSGVVSQAVSSVAPFGRQLFVDKDVRNSNLKSAIPSYRAPDPRTLVE